MNLQVREFFRTGGTQDPHFHEVRFLQEEPDAKWDEVSKSGVPRGWFELSRISVADRVDFTKEFWMGVLPYHPTASKGLEEFFDRLDDVGVLLCRQTTEEPWRAEMIYSLGDNSSFFRGLPPAAERVISSASRHLGRSIPRDFQAFLHLHNGFGKLTELGLIPVEEMEYARRRLIDRIVQSDKLLRAGESIVDPHSLYPFYQEYDGSGQCFFSEWYPGSEMGNVYFSGIDYIISDIADRKSWSEHLAYPTFVEWLSGFLGGMNVAP